MCACDGLRGRRVKAVRGRSCPILPFWMDDLGRSDHLNKFSRNTRQAEVNKCAGFRAASASRFVRPQTQAPRQCFPIVTPNSKIEVSYCNSVSARVGEEEIPKLVFWEQKRNVGGAEMGCAWV